MTHPFSLLIVHPGALGDLVSIFPLIQTLRGRFQRLGILAQSSLGRLVAAEGLVNDWHPIEAAWMATLFAGEPSPEARRILSPFGSILVFSYSEALAACLQGIAGARTYRLPPRPPSEERIHVADFIKANLLSWSLITEKDWNAADHQENLSVRQRASHTRLVTLHPGAGSLRKRWPLEGFFEAAENLQRAGWIPEFMIGPAEEDLLAPIEKTGFKFQRPVDLLELLTVLRSASAYIGNDSGVSHLAAWAGLPSVVIFGPADQLRWAPRGRRVQVVRPPLDCHPCFETASDNCPTTDCLTQITSKMVLDAYRRVAPGG